MRFIQYIFSTLKKKSLYRLELFASNNKKYKSDGHEGIIAISGMHSNVFNSPANASSDIKNTDVEQNEQLSESEDNRPFHHSPDEDKEATNSLKNSSSSKRVERSPGLIKRVKNLRRWIIPLLVLSLITLFLVANILNKDNYKPISYSDLIASVDKGDIVSIQVTNDTGNIAGEFIDGEMFESKGPFKLPENDLILLRSRGVKVDFHTEVTSTLSRFLPYVFIMALLIAGILFIQHRAQGQMKSVFSIGKSRAKTYDTELPSITFDDIAGYKGVKQEISEVVNFLKSPERFAKIGARVPKGILLVGPPGTGKTMLARAVAGEASVPFMSVVGSDFMEMFVGVGASRVRDLFNSARKEGKAIIFIDEIDSIGRKRGGGLGAGHDEREQTLNQMLSEMDGFEATEGIVIIAATNRPDVLDPALLRPGRFDRQIIVPLPEHSERLKILESHCKDKQVAKNIELDSLAKTTPGMSGADLANIINEAALHAVRHNRNAIAQEDLEASRDRIIMGQRREAVAMIEHERKITAYHEGGHALVATLMPNADPVHKVTILPTGLALGLTMQLPEERHSYNQHYLEDRLAVLFGGRMAEEIVFGVTSTGASKDLIQGTEIAHRMVSEWGMSSRIGPTAWVSHAQVFLGKDLMSDRDYSEKTALIIDEEVRRILRAQQERARETLVDNRKALDIIAAALLEKETLTGKEIAELFAKAGICIGDKGADKE